jgi:deoxyribose-phosphate aldolase
MDIDRLIKKVSGEICCTREGYTCNRRCARAIEAKAVQCPPEGVDTELAAMIDHTLLKPDATYDQIETLCEEAVTYGFASVCVNPGYCKFAYELLKGSCVAVCTVIGFPLGSTTAMAKAFEVRDAIANGASEVDMVMNIGALKSGEYEYVMRDMESVVDAAAGQALVKVIIETGLLTNEEKIRACLIAKRAGADFVKTSTGFGHGGATVEDVALMRKTVGSSMGVKASGGIRDVAAARSMVAAGANRIGASAGVKIVTEKK